jgi:hypothetical protein
LLGIIELAAARQRDEIHAGARKRDTEIDRVLDAVAALDAFFRQEADADGKLFAHAAANLGQDFKRQPRPVFERAAIPVRPRIGAREE